MKFPPGVDCERPNPWLLCAAMGYAEHHSVLVSPEEYLAAEAGSDRKHEYVGGVVYSMAGGPAGHSQIATNATASLHAKLRGHKCRVFNSDMLVRVRFSSHTRFYYPDTQVVCRPISSDQTFQDEPAVIVEVISESTRRTDEQEKREAYLSIGSLHAYILLEQKSAMATVWRRHSSGFTAERWAGLDATVPLPEIEASLPLAEVYEAVEFPTDTTDELPPR